MAHINRRFLRIIIIQKHRYHQKLIINSNFTYLNGKECFRESSIESPIRRRRWGRGFCLLGAGLGALVRGRGSRPTWRIRREGFCCLRGSCPSRWGGGRSNAGSIPDASHPWIGRVRRKSYWRRSARR